MEYFTMITTKKQRTYIRNYMARRRRKLGVLTKNEVKVRNTNAFLEKARTIHNNRYDYSNVLYKNKYSKVKINCSKHGTFKQSPDAHQRGQGCPQCAQENRLMSRKRKTLSQFVHEANLKHQGKYTYEDAQYFNLLTKTSITCPRHGSFIQSPKAHLSGQGCPTCADDKRTSFYESRGEKMVEQVLLANNIKYVKQKTFPDCKHKMLLLYDFFLPDHNILVEYDGEQHYKFTPRFHGTRNGFEVMQKRDKIKNVYAEKNGITLIRIRWDEEYKVSELSSLLCGFTTEMWKKSQASASDVC